MCKMFVGFLSSMTQFIFAFTLILSSLQVAVSSANHSSKALLSLRSVLYVWAGQDPTIANAADFVAVVDFTELSPTYGSILRVSSLVSDATNGIGQANNEPHHSSISLNRRFYITGGLLSFLSKQKEIFVWKIPLNPINGPRFVCAVDAPGSACPDEFQPIGRSLFLVSMMCNEKAKSPGDLVLVNAQTCSAKSFLKNGAALENFNPHGYGRLSNGSILTADYIVPITLTEADPSKIVFQSTARHFFPDGSLQRTLNFPLPTGTGDSTGLGSGIGFMELKPIPNDLLGRAYACGTNTNEIYLIRPGIREPLPVFDTSIVNGFVKRPSAGILTMFPTGKHALMTFQMRFVLLFDIRIPETPKLLHSFDFCNDYSVASLPIRVPGTTTTTTFPQFCAENNNIVGTHVVMHPPGERRFVVVNYFLKFGLAQFSGTRSVHAFKLNTDLSGFVYDHRFNPNFASTESSKLTRSRQTFYSLQAYPHHVQYLKI